MSSQEPPTTTSSNKKSFKVSLLDYGAGNVRSVRNALLANGYEIDDIITPDQIWTAKCIVFPGVGSFGSAMRVLQEKGFEQPLREYLSTFDRPFLGICLGMQTLFESSDEVQHDQEHDTTTTSSSIPGLGVIPGKVIKFDAQKVGAVPHIGWNGRVLHQESPVLKYVSPGEDVYFVHSYYAPILAGKNDDCILTSTTYNGQAFISSIQKGSVVATQFHPEKSGSTGLHVLKGFLEVRMMCVCVFLCVL
jgi:imidazole glycerol-phosphate synthase